jgi:integrase
MVPRAYIRASGIVRHGKGSPNMVRKTTRRSKRVLVIDFSYVKPDGTQGRYRRDAAVQTMAAAQTEDTARRMGATLHADPEILCGPNGQPLRPAAQAPTVEAPPETTFGETLTRYLSEYAPSVLRPSTRENYHSHLRAHVLPGVGSLAVSAAFDIARLREIDVAMVEGGSSVSLRRNTAAALKSVASFAVEAKLLAHAPKFPPAPKRGKRVPTAPTSGDVALVIDAVTRPEHRLVILLAAHAGLRKGEIRALRCSDCELDRGRIVVRLSRYRAHVVGPTKSRHEREVPLTPQLREALLAVGVDRRPRGECAALSTLGTPWGCNGPYEVFQQALRRVKLPGERLHALRAFFVTTLLNGNVPAHVVREMVGHGDLATTQAYAAIVAGDRGSAVGVLDRAYQDARTARPESVDASETRRRPASVRTRRQRSRLAGRPRTMHHRVLRRRSTGNNSETPPNAVL